VLYHLVFLNHTFSSAAKENPSVIATAAAPVITIAAAPKDTTATYLGGFSSKRKNNYF